MNPAGSTPRAAKANVMVRAISYHCAASSGLPFQVHATNQRPPKATVPISTATSTIQNLIGSGGALIALGGVTGDAGDGPACAGVLVTARSSRGDHLGCRCRTVRQGS